MFQFKNKKGASTTEMGLLIGLIAVAIILAVRGTGTEIESLFNKVGTNLNDSANVGAGNGSGNQQNIDNTSCLTILNTDLNAASGTFQIDPDGDGGVAAFNVYCDMTRNGGGWALIAKNTASTTFTNFNKNWAQFKAGFGSVSSSGMGWIGNDNMHAMTDGGKDLVVRTDAREHVYQNFSVGTEANNYRLSVSSTPDLNDNNIFASGHSGYNFSTFDRDNDTWGSNCASNFAAGWWHGSCYGMSLAGNATGRSYWRDNNGANEYFDTIEMWVR